ncbi:hypothetical protein EWE75_13600 [Sphingomonas populi]|uniref:Uncharacterized protein n=1 Tax=Sphingomonas populi TaxID=2484750 RepID=A0A4Q6Y4D8_9SPHN|nr:hypothetical protein [Sphingomonas populi]RZF64006.1 hypothetical protein EWE75_13600 [Sphingomonas populi]
MKVRVFIPKEHDPVDGSDFGGEDFNFDALPQVGQSIQVSGAQSSVFEVERVGFIQEGSAFVSCVWLRAGEKFERSEYNPAAWEKLNYTPDYKIL